MHSATPPHATPSLINTLSCRHAYLRVVSFVTRDDEELTNVRSTYSKLYDRVTRVLRIPATIQVGKGRGRAHAWAHAWAPRGRHAILIQNTACHKMTILTSEHQIGCSSQVFILEEEQHEEYEAACHIASLNVNLPEANPPVGLQSV